MELDKITFWVIIIIMIITQGGFYGIQGDSMNVSNTGFSKLKNHENGSN
jgi:hypothetical protein